METVPKVAMSLAVIAAVNWVLLTKEVLRLEPFHSTDEVLRNPDPFTVKVKEGPPAAALAGEMVLIEGTGLFCGGGGVEPPFPPPQLAHQSSPSADNPQTRALNFLARFMPCASGCNIGLWLKSTRFGIRRSPKGVLRGAPWKTCL
jgi:hypothetical protein